MSEWTNKISEWVNRMDGIDEICIFFIILFLFMMVFFIIIGKSIRVPLENYRKIYIGMSETEMLSIMGKKYNKSSFKGNRYRYEWRMNGSSASYKGIRVYSGVRKVDIIVQDGVVEEIRPYNV